MYIKEINIRNFKCFKDKKIVFDPNFNLIIGENNSGKSTLFEALRLWQLAIQQFYTARTRKTEQNIGFYRKYEYQALETSDLSFLRIQDIKDVFNNEKSNSFEIEVCFSDSTNEAYIPINFKRTSRESINCRINFEYSQDRNKNEQRLKKISDALFKTMGIETNDTFRNRIRLAYIPPKFNLPNKEVLLSEKNKFISDNLILGKSQLIIRNILHPWCELSYRRETKSSNLLKIKHKLNELINENDFETNFNESIKPYIEKIKNFKLVSDSNNKKSQLSKVEKGLKEILSQNFDFISYKDPTKESALEIKNKKDKIEISQLGSGTINVLNILSVLEYNNQTLDKAATKCNILLLDEPDSHLHSNLQSKLFSHLEAQARESNTQIFIITHNSSLISQFENVLFFHSKSNSLSPIPITEYLENHLFNMDFNQYEVIKKLNESKRRQTELEEQLNKSNEIVILFEGNTDIVIFKEAFFQIYKKDFPFAIQNKVRSASELKVAINSHSNPNGFLIGIFDNDYDGQTQFNNIDNTFSSSEGLYKEKDNKLAMLLPVSKDRNLPFYRKNFTIEYMFSDKALRVMKVELIKDEGESYFKIIPRNNSKAYCIPDSEKQKVANNCKNLSENEFDNFKAVFEKIFEFTNYNPID